MTATISGSAVSTLVALTTTGNTSFLVATTPTEIKAAMPTQEQLNGS